MKLEAAARGGKVIEVELPFAVEDDRKALNTPVLFLKLLELKERGHAGADIAATAQWALALGLARIAIQAAREQGIEEVALGGGVAYNDAITLAIRDEVERAGFKLYVNERVPCGDGGVSFGQAVVAGTRLRLEG
jgi:hydrogenase maturation protein HypF